MRAYLEYIPEQNGEKENLIIHASSHEDEEMIRKELALGLLALTGTLLEEDDTDLAYACRSAKLLTQIAQTGTRIEDVELVAQFVSSCDLTVVDAHGITQQTASIEDSPTFRPVIVAREEIEGSTDDEVILRIAETVGANAFAEQFEPADTFTGGFDRYSVGVLHEDGKYMPLVTVLDPSHIARK